MDQTKGELAELRADIKVKVQEGSAALAADAARTRLELDEALAKMAEREEYFAEAGKYMEGYKNMQKAFEVPFRAAGLGERKTDISHKTALKRAHTDAIQFREQLLVARNDAVTELEEVLANPSKASEAPKIRERFKGSMKEVAKELQMNLDHASAVEKEMKKLSTRDQTQFEIDGKFCTQDEVIDRYSLQIQVSQDDTRSFRPLGANQICPSCNARSTLCPHKVPESDYIIELPSSVTHLRLTRPVRRFADLPEPPEPVLAEIPAPSANVALPADGAVGGVPSKHGKSGSKKHGKDSSGKKKKGGKKGSGTKSAKGKKGSGDKSSHPSTAVLPKSSRPSTAASATGDTQPTSPARAPSAAAANGNESAEVSDTLPAVVEVGKLPPAEPPNQDGSQFCRLEVERPAVHRAPRKVEPPSMRSMLRGFYSTLPPYSPGDETFEDDGMTVDGNSGAAAILSPQEAFIRYLERRYVFPEIATAVANDVVEAIEASPNEPYLLVIGQVLHGKLAAVAPRHYGTFAAILAKIPPVETAENVKHVLDELYPFISDDDRGDLYGDRGDFEQEKNNCVRGCCWISCPWFLKQAHSRASLLTCFPPLMMSQH
jgi:hypothetical protein